MGCAVKQIQSPAPGSLKAHKQPHYRQQDTLAVHVYVPQRLKKVRGINQYVHRQFAHANRVLDTQFNLRLHPIFAQPHQRALSMLMNAEAIDGSSFTASPHGSKPSLRQANGWWGSLASNPGTQRAPEGTQPKSSYGHFQFEVLISVDQIATPGDRSLAKQLYTAILEHLGLPAPCLKAGSLSRDGAKLQAIIEQHLVRDDGRIELTQVPIAQIAKQVLASLKSSQRMPSCFATLIGKERLYLWQDVDTLRTETEHPRPIFLQDANRALSESNFKKAYALCGPEAERRPQTGSARCAAQAAQGLENYIEASRMWRAHLAFFPDDQPAIIALARCIGRQGDDDTARAILQINVQRFPNWLDAQIELGIALYRLKQPVKARDIWRAVLKDDPNNEDAQHLLRQY